MKTIKQRIFWCDVIVVGTFVLMLLIKLTTLAIFSYINVETKAQIEDVATMYEANPFFKLLMNFRFIGYLLTFFILPASAMAYYYFVRRKVLQGKADIDVLEFFVQFGFFLALINMVNDGGVLIGKIL